MNSNDREHKFTNRLIHEKSPYLLQHAHNPVNWFPWGQEAFQKAAHESKAVFLSIGYSTCHWCHVMERESFEDTEVAEILNRDYVAIKVDREERPDIDHIYMTVCQAMTGQGGWPLTILMTPDQKPFFAGTYFPKRQRYGRPGLLDVLTQIREKWENDRGQIDEAVRKITDYLQRSTAQSSQGKATDELLKRACQTYEETFDEEYGGFGDAPKFPTPHQLIFLLRYGVLANHPKAIEMVESTLRAMYAGGLYDHIGFGFARYSTDRRWLVPHFEKMLYDNALLALAYLEAYQVTGKPEYSQVVRDIFTYVSRDMTDVNGGFYCAEDADSEGVEGKFYLWTPDEVKAVLGQEAGEKYCLAYDITQSGNFEGHSIPNLIQTALPETDAAALRAMNAALFAVREKRVHPHKDDKILTAWNGLMIAALARAGRVLDEPRYIQAAAKAEDFVSTSLTDESGRLLARYRDGQASHLGYADDYALTVWGLIELYEATGDFRYLKRSVDLQQDMNDRFWDAEGGGFFFYGSDGESLIVRPKEIYDGAMPSGNSVAALNLLRLSRMTGDARFTELAEAQLHAFAAEVERYPAGYAFYLLALQFAFGKTREVVIAGGAGETRTEEMLRVVRTAYLPLSVLLFHPSGDAGRSVEALAEFVRNQQPVNGQPAAYVCEQFACQAPVTEPAKLAELLGGSMSV